MDEHIIEALGKARIVVKDGKVAEVGEPLIKLLPDLRQIQRNQNSR